MLINQNKPKSFRSLKVVKMTKEPIITIPIRYKNSTVLPLRPLGLIVSIMFITRVPPSNSGIGNKFTAPRAIEI